MKLNRIFSIILISITTSSYADIYKCIDGSGKVRFSNVSLPSLKCSKVGVDNTKIQDTQHNGKSNSSDDLEALKSFNGLPQRWNMAAAPLVRDYLDPNIPSSQWVLETSQHIGELRAVVFEMYARTLAIQNPESRKQFKELTSNYGEKLNGLVMLHNAVANGDEKLGQDALQLISIASSEGQVIALSILDKLRPLVDPKSLSEELLKNSIEIGELMKPKELKN